MPGGRCRKGDSTAALAIKASRETVTETSIIRKGLIPAALTYSTLVTVDKTASSMHIICSMGGETGGIPVSRVERQGVNTATASV